MIAANEDALICDIAETYGIVNYRALPVNILATLCVGLRDNSRIKMHLNDAQIPLDTQLLAAIADRLSYILWTKTKDAEAGRNKPKLILNALLNVEKTGGEIALFDSAEEFEAARQKIIGKE